MPSCPPGYECTWSQVVYTPPGNWWELVAIIAIVAIAILIGLGILVYEETHKSMKFEVK